jgi:hypothetical protein
MVAIAAPLADEQPLEQITTAVRLDSVPQPVLLKLLLNHREQLLADQCRNFNEDLFLSCRMHI